MVDLKLFSSKTGLAVCLMLEDGKITYSNVSNEYLELITKDLKNILLNLPKFRGGLFEIEGRTFVVFRIKEGFIISPIQSENIGSIYYSAERVLEEIER